MTLPSQVARPMSASATKFTSSRPRASSRRALGWGLLLVVIAAAAWWALSGRVGGGSEPPTSDQRVRLAAAEALDTPASREPIPAPEPKKESNPPAQPPTFTMGRVPAPQTEIPTTISASNTPGLVASDPPARSDVPADPAPGSLTVPGVTETPRSEPASGAGGAAGVPVPTGSAVAFLVMQGDALLSSAKPVEARDVYNRALNDARATEGDRAALRAKLATLAETLTFSPRIEPGDATCEAYAFQAGDRLVKLPYAKGLKVDWRLITRVNRIADPNRIGLNQKMKLVKGPFHAVVSKSAYRMDVFADAKDSQGNRLYIRSFRVGLGEHGSTPTGAFIVKPRSKLVNPRWVNPRTGEKFDADDPKNPIGERWIGLQGTDKSTELLSGYGIHGTIDDASIGTEASMGCVRMLAPDIELVYEMLFEGASTVEIRP